MRRHGLGSAPLTGDYYWSSMKDDVATVTGSTTDTSATVNAIKAGSTYIQATEASTGASGVLYISVSKA